MKKEGAKLAKNHFFPVFLFCNFILPLNHHFDHFLYHASTIVATTNHA
jgi:hypothetical protein